MAKLEISSFPSSYKRAKVCAIPMPKCGKLICKIVGVPSYREAKHIIPMQKMRTMNVNNLYIVSFMHNKMPSSLESNIVLLRVIIIVEAESIES